MTNVRAQEVFALCALCVEVEREIKNHSPWPAVAAGVVEVAMARQQPKHLDVEREIGKFVVVGRSYVRLRCGK